jgi:hypothetical protein
MSDLKEKSLSELGSAPLEWHPTTVALYENSFPRQMVLEVEPYIDTRPLLETFKGKGKIGRPNRDLMLLCLLMV